MEASNITMFKDLDVSNNDCVLKGRILRLWRLKDNNKIGEDWSIEMILQDEMGDMMQAYVRKACIPKHDVWLDVIGHVSRFFTIKNSFFRESQHQNRRTIEFADLSGNKIYLTLWDDYLKQLTKYVADNQDEEYLIIVLQFARVKYYEEIVYFNNSYGNAVLRLLINDYLYEVLDYKKRLLKISSQVHVEIPKQAKKVIITGTVKAIVGNKEWYYNGCKRCSRKVSEVFVDGVKVYECKSASCNYLGVNAGPSFEDFNNVAISGFDAWSFIKFD
ncbi:uncharacterized protein LOC143585573 [Bidens hawaiensis]|uniref:uncharacterized protein LOC143585573 n=1 Tax=Bidens hawaiensis TaxID=980011 RepID=UPI00404A2412